MSAYFEALRDAMALLAADERTVFIGQSVRYDSNALFRTLQREDKTLIVPMDRRIELPVIEDFQMGLSTGMALEGFIPVSIFQRFDFLLLACNQLVNHLDKIDRGSGFHPSVIIRTAVGATHPFRSGEQQSGDYSAALRLMLRRVKVIELNSRFDVLSGYDAAYQNAYNGHSTIVVERMDLYNE